MSQMITLLRRPVRYGTTEEGGAVPPIPAEVPCAARQQPLRTDDSLVFSSEFTLSL
ncbi:hypothetical protein SALBM135S_04589 [Streptomyces alboniger]